MPCPVLVRASAPWLHLDTGASSPPHLYQQSATAKAFAALALSVFVDLTCAVLCGGEVCEEAGLLQVTSKSSPKPVPSLVQHLAQHSGQLEQHRLEGVRNVHSELAALAQQKLAEQDAKGGNETFALSSETQAVLDTVLTNMEALLDEVNASHVTDEQLLVDAANNFVQCNTRLAQRQALSNALSASVATAGQAHDSCRTTEQSLAEANTTAFTAYQDYGKASLSPEVLACMANFVNGASNYIHPETQDHLQNISTCAATIAAGASAFSDQMTLLRDAWLSSLSALDNQSEQCRVNQSTLESRVCEYRRQLTDSCQTLDECIASANTTFQELRVSIAASDERRVQAFISTQKVICYVNVLKSNLTHPAVQACQDLVVDTSPIDVTEPTPAEPDNCDTSPVTEFPCTTAWLQANYYSKTWYTGNTSVEPDTCLGLRLFASVCAGSREVGSHMSVMVHVFLWCPDALLH